MLCCAPYACDRILLQLLVVCLQFCLVVVASCWLSSGVVQLSVLLLLHARTHFKKKKKKKKIAPVTRMVVVTRRFVTYGIRAGSTRDLGFATASVDMIMFDYSVADRVDCVCAGNHG
jgi:O-antigen/teichoic acid export membrane protein